MWGVGPKVDPIPIEATFLTLNVNRRLVDKCEELSAMFGQLNPAPKVIFIQEAGMLGQDPAGALELLLPDFTAFLASSESDGKRRVPRSHNASVVTLVAKTLAPSVRRIGRAPNGAALLVQVGEVLLVNTYLPAGLDWASPHSRVAEQADLTYDWIADQLKGDLGTDHWIVAGDFNETTRPAHRTSGGQRDSLNTEARTCRSSRRSHLEEFLFRVGGTDLNNGVHTFARSGSTSLLDRFVCPREQAHKVSQYTVLPTACSDHDTVVMKCAGLPLLLRSCANPWVQAKFIIPTDPMKRQRAGQKCNEAFHKLAPDLVAQLDSCTGSAQLEEASARLSRTFQQAARGSFRMTQDHHRRKPQHSRRWAKLKKMRVGLVGLRDILVDDHCLVTTKMISKIAKEARGLLPDCPRHPDTDLATRLQIWDWTVGLLRATRKALKLNKKRIDWDDMVKGEEIHLFASRIAKKGRPPPVTVVRDPSTGVMTEDPEVVKQQLLLRITEPMRRPINPPARLARQQNMDAPPVEEEGLPDWFEEIYVTPAPAVDHWGKLMLDPTWEELRKVIGKANKRTSPGDGALGIDIIQCCIDWRVPFNSSYCGDTPGHIAQAILAFLRAVLRVGVYPAHLCVAWITAIDKGTGNPLDVRPISVLPELYRLVSRVLNSRLLDVFLKYPLLHKAQRAGHRDGDFMQCTKVVCNIVEDARLTGLLTMMCYDQSKAFDLVSPQAIIRACKRIHLPERFQKLVVSAITRAKARVRTFFGLSEPIQLIRSLRQGDPLASILYCIYIDPLHWALERWGGYEMGGMGTRVASQGFMDDTVVFANTFQKAVPLHRIVVEFSMMNDGSLNNKKSLLFLMDHLGDEEKRYLHTKAGVILPVNPGKEGTNRYLGMWLNLELDWTVMDNKIRANFWRVYYIILNNRLSLKACRTMIDLWLLAPLNHALVLARYSRGKEAVASLNKLQRILNVLIARVAGCPHPKNWGGPIASILFGLKDMHQRSVHLNLENLHLSLNYPPDLFLSAATSLDRLIQFRGIHEARDADEGAPPPARCTSSAAIRGIRPHDFTATRSLGCDMAQKMGLALDNNLQFIPNGCHSNAGDFTPSVLERDTFWKLFLAEEGGMHPSVDLVRSLYGDMEPEVWDINAYDEHWLRDLLILPDELVLPGCISCYTDGSSKTGQDSGAAVIFSFKGRKILTVRTRLRRSKQNFMAECVGCLLAVRFAPLNWGAETVCDCDSALYAVTRPTAGRSWRRRLSGAARPVLECTGAILRTRQAPMAWRSIKSHTKRKKGDRDTFFNDVADKEAKAAREIPLRRGAPRNRVWRWGAEKAIFATTEYPSLSPDAGSQEPTQIIGAVSGFLARLGRISLTKKAAKAPTMGAALRYNGRQVLNMVQLMGKTISSTQHAVMAMALASYLPVANRSSWGASKHPTESRCRHCASGLKQDSAHLFSCPRLLPLVISKAKRQRVTLEREVRARAPGLWDSLLGVVDSADYIRDCLAMHALGWDTAERRAPLSWESLTLVPCAILRLAHEWASQWIVGPEWRGAGGRRVCPAGGWATWLRSMRLEVVLASSRGPDVWNSAPLPVVWETLRDAPFPEPLLATVFDGSPALPPPSCFVWYTADEIRSRSAWWALPLPSLGAHMRLMEWAPLATYDRLLPRMKWWEGAVTASNDSVILVVVPEDLAQQVENMPESVLVLGGSERAIPLPIAMPMEPSTFWVPQKVLTVKAKCLLLLNPKITVRMRSRWAEALRFVSTAFCRSELRLGCSMDEKRHCTFVPASWWWGPTRFALPESAAPARPSPLDHFGDIACNRGQLCNLTCSPAVQLREFNRYLGNLGVPPCDVSILMEQGSTAILEGDRAAPRWMLDCWDDTQDLLARLVRKRPP